MILPPNFSDQKNKGNAYLKSESYVNNANGRLNRDSRNFLGSNKSSG